ncbi:hypothetical protein D3C80_1963640 [compost metagenome]
MQLEGIGPCVNFPVLACCLGASALWQIVAYERVYLVLVFFTPSRVIFHRPLPEGSTSVNILSLRLGGDGQGVKPRRYRIKVQGLAVVA